MSPSPWPNGPGIPRHPLKWLWHSSFTPLGKVRWGRLDMDDTSALYSLKGFDTNGPMSLRTHSLVFFFCLLSLTQCSGVCGIVGKDWCQCRLCRLGCHGHFYCIIGGHDVVWRKVWSLETGLFVFDHFGSGGIEFTRWTQIIRMFLPTW